ncbi:hypothetical protein L3Q82_023489 [Scortum barcoo]|uniref:Uncharacterized protein n=1 Tax=Scortum barcoo TaxID=214431 RepID=A0ACB8WT27_9TELE|nr:hypothetical protein L3Q82_023489 [Scortum barcoo]
MESPAGALSSTPPRDSKKAGYSVLRPASPNPRPGSRVGPRYSNHLNRHSHTVTLSSTREEWCDLDLDLETWKCGNLDLDLDLDLNLDLDLETPGCSGRVLSEASPPHQFLNRQFTCSDGDSNLHRNLLIQIDKAGSWLQQAQQRVSVSSSLKHFPAPLGILMRGIIPPVCSGSAPGSPTARTHPGNRLSQLALHHSSGPQRTTASDSHLCHLNFRDNVGLFCPRALVRPWTLLFLPRFSRVDPSEEEEEKVPVASY